MGLRRRHGILLAAAAALLVAGLGAWTLREAERGAADAPPPPASLKVSVDRSPPADAPSEAERAWVAYQQPAQKGASGNRRFVVRGDAETGAAGPAPIPVPADSTGAPGAPGAASPRGAPARPVAAPVPRPPWPEAGAGVRGRIELPEALPAKRVNVWLLAAPNEAEAIPLERILKEGKSDMAWDGSGYRFWFRDLPPGRYRVAVLRQDDEDVARDLGCVVAPEPPGVCTVVLPPPDRAETIRVRARTVEGSIPPGLRLSVAYVEGDRVLASDTAQPEVGDGWRLVSFAPTGGRERWPRIGTLPRFDAVRGRFEVLATCDLGALRADVAPGPDAAAELAFDPPGSLRVLVSGLDLCEQRTSLHAYVAESGGKRRFVQGPAKDEFARTGLLELPAVQPGNWAFVVRLGRQGDGRSWEVLRTSVTVGTGLSELHRGLPTLHTIDLTQWSRVLLEHLGAPEWQEWIEPRPQGALRGLPPGHYRASGEEDVAEFDLPGDKKSVRIRR